jgi:hypothetical protein
MKFLNQIHLVLLLFFLSQMVNSAAISCPTLECNGSKVDSDECFKYDVATKNLYGTDCGTSNICELTRHHLVIPELSFFDFAWTNEENLDKTSGTDPLTSVLSTKKVKAKCVSNAEHPVQAGR